MKEKIKFGKDLIWRSKKNIKFDRQFRQNFFE